jgi:surface protein
MFYGCRNFNSDLSKWDVSNGKQFDKMFRYCSSFDADLSEWDVSKATSWDEFCVDSLLEKYPERIPERFRKVYL